MRKENEGMPAYTVGRYDVPAKVAELEQRHERITHVLNAGDGLVVIFTASAVPDVRTFGESVALTGTVTR